MPQLPVYLAQGMPGTRMPSTSPDLNVLEENAQNLTKVAGVLVRTGQAMTRQQQEVAEKTRVAQQAMAASKAFAASATAAEDLHGQLQSEPDFETIPEKMQAGLQEIYKTQRATLTDPAAQQLYDRDFLRLNLQKTVEATHLRNTKRIDNGLANYESTVNTLTDLAGRVNPEDLPAITEQIQLATRIAGLQGLMTQAQAVERERKALAGVALGVVQAEINRNPDQAMLRIDAGQGIYGLLPEDKRIQLREHAEARSRSILAEQNRQETLAAKAYEDAYQQGLTTMAVSARNGQATLTDLEAFRQSWRTMKREDYEHLRDLIERPKSAPSNPAVLQAFDIGVRSLRPTVTKDQLATAYRNNLLSREDYDKLDQKLTEVRTHAQDEAKSDVRFRHSQAEELLKTSLRFQNPLEIINQASQQTMAAALDDFLKGSSATGGTLDPFTVGRAVIDKYLPTVAQAAEARLNLARVTSGMQWKDKQALSADYYNKSKDAAYYSAAARFDEWDRTQAEIDRMRGKMGGAPKPTQTTPGQKDQFGRETKQP